MRIVLLAALLLAGCSDPTITITIENPPPRKLAGGPVTTTLSVVLADDAVTCDHVRYGRISAEALAGGRQASVAADGSGHITGVPRLGHIVGEAPDLRALVPWKGAIVTDRKSVV